MLYSFSKTLRCVTASRAPWKSGRRLTGSLAFSETSRPRRKRLKALSPSHYPEGGSPIWRAMRNLGVAIRHRVGRGEISEDTIHEAAALIDELAQKIERLK